VAFLIQPLTRVRVEHVGNYTDILKAIKGLNMLPAKRLWLLATVISLPVFIWQAGNIISAIAALILATKQL
jgi:hypothetical protein